MKKLSAALFVAALVAIATVATALARGTTDNATSAGMSGMAGMSPAEMLSHGGGSGASGASGESGPDGRRDEPGEDVPGRCDEAEHAGDADCSTSTVRSSTVPTSTSRTTTSAAAAVVSGRRLVATVGPGFAITLTTPGGAPARTLTAGTYSVVVRDLSTEHNFHLIGPGFNRATALSTSTRRTWQVTFKRGTYTYRCDPHASMMHGTISVR